MIITADPSIQKTPSLPPLALPPPTSALHSVLERIEKIVSPPSLTSTPEGPQKFSTIEQTVTVEGSYLLCTTFLRVWNQLSERLCTQRKHSDHDTKACTTTVNRFLAVEFIPSLDTDVFYAHSTGCASFAIVAIRFEHNEQLCSSSISTSEVVPACRNKLITSPLLKISSFERICSIIEIFVRLAMSSDDCRVVLFCTKLLETKNGV